MKFAMPEYADVTILSMEISEAQENVDIKFTIAENRIDEFIDTLCMAGYSEHTDLEEFAVPHPEATNVNWDMDYDRLDRLFMGNGTRISSKYRHRLHIYLYFLSPENGEVTVYLSCNG